MEVPQFLPDHELYDREWSKSHPLWREALIESHGSLVFNYLYDAINHSIVGFCFYTRYYKKLKLLTSLLVHNASLNDINGRCYHCNAYSCDYTRYEMAPIAVFEDPRVDQIVLDVIVSG